MIYSSLFLILASLLSLHAQPVPTPANIVCYQEVVASQGSYAQINASLSAWSVKMIQTLGLTGPSDLIVGWARVPDRTGFENGCTGPYPNIADLFVHIQTTSSQFASVSASLESFIAANRMTSQPNIVCSARSIVTFLPGCGQVGSGGSPPNNNGSTSGNSTTAPTQATTQAPTNASTTAPTTAPTEAPTTKAPTTAPTVAPTTAPTTAPTAAPTEAPTQAPTRAPTTAPTSAPTSAPTAAGPVTKTVTVNNIFYSPADTTINVGDTVQWTWVSGTHTVTSGTPGSPDGKFCSLSGGAAENVASCSAPASSYAKSPPFTYSHTFTAAGSYPYYCGIHLSQMTGNINVVQPTSVAGAAAADQSGTGQMYYSGATAQSLSMTGTWMVIISISTFIMFQY